MDIIKKGLIKVPTQPENSGLRATAIVFKSYDKEIALEMHISKQDGTPADLLGANIRLLMNIYDEIDGQVVKEPVPFITKNVVTESYLHGVVKYILPEALKAYNGTVETFVYVEYPDGSSSDNLAFTFRMERSKIDGIAQDKADYFIQDFQDLLAEASLQAGEVIEGLDTQIKELQQAATDATNAANDVTERIDGLEAEIEQLERLREMYIDTLDFEGYDYSGRPNLMRNIKLEDLSLEFTRYIKPTNVTMENRCFVIDVTKMTGNQGYYILDVPRGLEGKRYTYSVEAKADVATQGVAIRPVYHDGSALAALTPASVGSLTTTMTRYKLTTNALTSQQVNSYVQAFQVYIVPSGCTAEKIYIKTNIKIEEGTEASGFQPNLLAEPYNMCRKYPNENMIPGTNLPVTTSNQLITQQELISYLVKGKVYTVTLKGTKPSAQDFSVFIADNGNNKMGDMKPVEGLSDCWQLTFTYNRETQTSGTKQLRIYQKNTPFGSCKIEWLKIEEGEVSTPIDVPTYKGLGILDTNDPTKYVWNYTELVDVDGIQDALENVEQRTATLEGKANTIDGRLNNVNTTLNTVQSTADQILAEITAADVMKETDLPSYLANKPIVAGGMADFAGKVERKVHPNPHKLANYALAYEHANQAPSKCFTYECSQASYDKMKSLDGNALGTATNTAGQTGTSTFKFDLISQIAKDYPSFFDDCPTQGEKVMKIRNYIESAVLTVYSKNTNSECYIESAAGEVWGAQVVKGSSNESTVTEKVYDQLKQNLYTRARVQDDGSIIFRARTRTIQASETNVTVKQEVDYARLDYTLNLSSDDFITPIERDVTKDNLTQILSDDSVTIKGVTDFKFKDRGNNNLCPHAVYLKSTSAQATNMSNITYEADADMYSRTQNKDDGLASVLRPEATTGYVGQVKYKFNLVTAIEKEHPHLFKGLTTTKQKVDVLKAKIQELKFNVWARGEGTNGNIQIGSSLSNVDAIDARQTKDIGETTEFARAEFYSNNNDACARRINDDGTVLYWLCGSAVSDSLPQPKVIIDYVNLEYTLSDKPSDYIVKKDDPSYTGALAKLAGIRQYATQTTSADDSRNTHGAVYVGGNVWLAWDTKILENSSGFTAGNYKQFGTEDLPMFDFPDITTAKSGYMFLSGVAKAVYTNGGFGDYQISVENCFNDARKPIVRFIKTPSTPIKKVFVTVYALIFAAKPTVDQEITL